MTAPRHPPREGIAHFQGCTVISDGEHDRRLIVDEDTAARICRQRGIYDRVFPSRPALDIHALEEAYAAGELTDEDMISIMLEVHDGAPPTA